jgi:hypothetical protein
MKNADTGKYHSSSVNAYGNTVAHKTGFDSAEEAEQHGKKISSIGGGRTQAFHDSDVTHKNFKKVVKEQYDEEGNISYSKLSYKDFVDQLLEYTTGPGGVTRIQGRGYGNAKGAKYGSTDYDRENLDKNDDEGESSQPQKRGRGRPAGSKSGARGPRIK